MILPYVDYGDIFFINTNSKQLKKFQTLQNKAIRISLNAALEIPIAILHQSAQVPMLKARREVHLRNVMFKRKTDVNYLNMRNIRTRLHVKPVFELIKPTCEKYKNNVFYNGAVSWNTLPVHTRNIKKCEKFNFQQKRWALSELRIEEI